MEPSLEKTSFLESMAHVYSISLVHEQLYRHSSFTRIDLQEYLEQIISHLAEAFPVVGTPVSFQLDTAPVTLNIDQAIPCGLVLMELMSNGSSLGFQMINVLVQQMKGSISKERERTLFLLQFPVTQ